MCATRCLGVSCCTEFALNHTGGVCLVNEPIDDQIRKVGEDWRAQFPDQLDASSLGYKRLVDIPAGNLIYVPLDAAGQHAVAMRVARLNGGVPEALVFNHRTRDGEFVHALQTGYGNQRCIDWGLRPIVCWHHPLKEETPDNSQAAPPGPILLFGDRLAIRTYFGIGRGEAMYFDLKTGQEVEPAQDHTTVASWSLGVRSVNGAFLPLATYPSSRK